MKRLSIALILFVIATAANGQAINEEQARKNVSEFLNSVNVSKDVKANGTPARKLELAYTATNKDGEADFYVFNNNDGGFIIAGGDEVAEEILAYADEGSFDMAEIPENFRYWLGEYQRQISYAKANKVKAFVKAGDTGKRQDVGVLVKTKWDQGSPYNGNCPKVGGKSTYTGCVATAMAQVLRYYSWPEKGAGSHSYYDSESKKNLSADFSQHTYDWTNMPNKYSSMSKTAQKEAVALLMSDCGISVEMGYSTDGSGAWTENITYALMNFFGYDKGAAQVMRDYATASEWDSIIYNELSNSRPVIFSGTDKTGQYGHCFICDGYNSSTKKYHFNWGWGGEGDCYCSLSAVQISDDNEFSSMQDIIIGIQKPREDTKKPVYILAYDGELDLVTSTGKDYNTYSAQYTYTDYGKTISNIVYNHTNSDIDVIFAVKYTSTASGESYVTSVKDMDANKVSFKAMYPVVDPSNPAGVKKITIKDAIMPDMPVGKYKVTVVAKDYLDKDSDDASLWHEVLTYDTNKNYITVNHIPADITEVPANCNADSPRYDLTGRRVSPSYKGITIQNGRKYLK